MRFALRWAGLLSWFIPEGLLRIGVGRSSNPPYREAYASTVQSPRKVGPAARSPASEVFFPTACGRWRADLAPSRESDLPCARLRLSLGLRLAGATTLCFPAGLCGAIAEDARTGCALGRRLNMRTGFCRVRRGAIEHGAPGAGFAHSGAREDQWMWRISQIPLRC